MIDICKDHKIRSAQCKQCLDIDVQRSFIVMDTRMLCKEVQNIVSRKEKLTKRLEVLTNSIEKLGNGRSASNLPSFYTKKNFTLDYFYNLKLSNSIFDIIRSQEDSIAFMLQKGLVTPLKTCSCGKPLTFTQGGYGESIFVCQCKNSYKLFDKSIWEPVDTPAERILLYMVLWIMGLKDKYLRTISGVPKLRAVALESILFDQISDHYLKTVGKFRGVVEIDESCFKHTTTSKCKTQPEKWVFGLYERERKLTYMEVVSKRTASILLPIIEKVCEKGTTIVSDQWPAYNKLAEIGFPHYTVDHSRFFVNPTSREIHTQNIENSWCWAKYEIKRQNRKLGNLQRSLNLFCWKRQFKQENKVEELSRLINGICEIFRNLNENPKKVE